MFTFSLLYVFMYLFIFLGLLSLVFTQISLHIFTNYSAMSLMLFIQKYIPVKNLIFFLIFALTGLPPFGLFFVKFNILSFVLYQTHFFVIVILFLMFFLNMLYYAQLFNFKNFKSKNYHQFNADLFSKEELSTTFQGRRSTYSTYSLLLFIINTLTMLVFSILFFNDFFLIVNVI